MVSKMAPLIECLAYFVAKRCLERDGGREREIETMRQIVIKHVYLPNRNLVLRASFCFGRDSQNNTK